MKTGRDKKEDKETIQKSFFEQDGKKYEQVKGGQFVYMNGNAFHFINKVENDENIIIPCMGEEEIREVVLLAEKPEEYGTILDLVNEIQEFIHKWMDVTLDYEVFASWYILLTYVYDRVNTINYLRAMGDTGTGKSRFLNTIGKLCYKATIGSGGVTVAAVKRIIDKWRGTLVIDEADFNESDEKNELVKLFNLGFEKHNVIFNCDKNDPSKMEFFNPYCPKVLATRRQFQDQALEARCLTHVTQQTNRKDIPVVLPNSFFEKQKELRNKLLKFRYDYYDKIDIDKALAVDMGNIEPRIRQAINSFLPLIINDNKAFEAFKSFVISYNEQVIEERSSSFDGQIVNAVAEYIKNGTLKVTGKMISSVLESNGLKSSDRTVGRHLKQMGLKTEQIRDTEGVKKIVPIGQKLIDVFKRYISDEDLLCNVVSNVSVTIVDLPNPKKDQQTALTQKSHVYIYNDTNATTIQNKDTEGITIIQLSCHICGQKPSNFYDKTAQGKPICMDCKKFKNQQQEERVK